jgi:hypothetical protein
MKTGPFGKQPGAGKAAAFCVLFFSVIGFGLSAARAGCTIDFENLPVGAVVSNQYPGVAFSTGNLGPGCPPVYLRIYSPPAGTSSPSRCLRIDPGCPDLSPEFLVMVFSSAHNQVSFSLGEDAGQYTIRYYNNPGGTGTPGSFTVSVPPPGGVHQFVSVVSPGIRRIEVESNPRGFFEAIDDLSFDFDTTPPIAEISYPGYGTCDCDNVVSVFGRACDPDGTAVGYFLDYMSVYGTTWNPVGGVAAAACTPGSPLYAWNTTLVPADTYYLRLTVTNRCGLTSEALTLVTVRHSPGSISLRKPVPGQLVGGRICLDGTAGWEPCFGHYTVEWKPVSGGSFAPVDGTSPEYTIPISNDPIAWWDTRTNLFGGFNPDGDYILRLTVFDACGHSSTPQELTVSVDNTPPVATILSPIQCSKRTGLIQIFGTAWDAHLGNWVVQYSELNTHNWVSIASGTGSVVNGLLANWNTTGLPACAYALRLLVSDQAALGCEGGSHLTEYVQTLNLVSSQLAEDRDADGMPDVWELAHGFNPDDPSDAYQDADGDGRTNLEEYLAGTDPRDPASVLRITSIAREGNNTLLSWPGAAGRNYLLEAAPNLLPGSFSTVSPLISMPTGMITSFVHTNGATSPERLYRVRLVP